MEPTDRGMSKEAWVGIAVALVLSLLRVEEPVSRVIIIIVAGTASLLALRKSAWTKQTDTIITLSGKDFSDPTLTAFQKVWPYGIIILAFTVLGIVTWPSSHEGFSGDAVIIPGSIPSEIQFHPAPKPDLPNASPAQPQTNPGIGHVAGDPLKTAKPPIAKPMPPTNVKAQPE